MMSSSIKEGCTYQSAASKQTTYFVRKIVNHLSHDKASWKTVHYYVEGGPLAGAEGECALWEFAERVHHQLETSP